MKTQTAFVTSQLLYAKVAIIMMRRNLAYGNELLIYFYHTYYAMSLLGYPKLIRIDVYNLLIVMRTSTTPMYM